MYLPVMFGIFYILIFIQNAGGDPELFRQKRCIVIQKQSGTHGDSAEEEEDDYRRPQPKQPMPDRLREHDKYHDVEEISPELRRFTKRLDRLRLRKLNKYSYNRE